LQTKSIQQMTRKFTASPRPIFTRLPVLPKHPPHPKLWTQHQRYQDDGYEYQSHREYWSLQVRRKTLERNGINETPPAEGIGAVQKDPSSKAATAGTSGAYGGVREHGTGVRTPLAGFFNSPHYEEQLTMIGGLSSGAGRA
jgi:hypothetical protein